MICVLCSQEKGLAFYKADRTCKACRCASVRANRLKNLEYYREYDRDRASRPDRVTARLAYSRTPRGAQIHRVSCVKWEGRFPEKKRATTAVSNAIRDGRLIRQPCEKCGEPAQAHHEDYSKPMEVNWLCTKHHAARHAELRRIKRLSR